MKNCFIIAAIVFLLVGIVFVGVFFWHKHEADLPHIENPEKLRQECGVLFQQSPLPEVGKYSPVIPEEEYPATVRALHPFKVTKDKYAIFIWIQNHCERSSHCSWTERGYYIPANTNVFPTGRKARYYYYLEATKFDGILEFKKPIIFL